MNVTLQLESLQRVCIIGAKDKIGDSPWILQTIYINNISLLIKKFDDVFFSSNAIFL